MDYKDNWQENMNLLRFGLSNDQSFYELRRGLSQIDNSKLVSELKGDDIKRYKEAYDDIEKLYIEFQKKESVEVREKLRKRLDEIATVHKIDIQNYDENARYNKYQGQPLDEIPTTHQQSTIKPLVHEDEAFKKYKQVYVTNDNDLNKAILHYEKSKNVAIDTETARYILPHDAHTRLVQLHDPDTDVVHIIDMDKINDPKVLSHLMRKTKSNLVFQNASYDLAFLTKAGILKESDIEDKGFTDRIFDTMHVSRSIDAERDKHDLSSIASRVLGVNLTKKTDHDWASSKLRKSQIKYAAYDVIATGQIFKTMMQKNPKVASITNLFMGDISKNFKANLSRYMGLDTRTLTVIDNGVKKQMKMNDVLNFAGESIRGNKNRQIFLPDVPVAAFDKQMRSGGYSIYDLNNRVRYGSFAPDSLNKINSEILGKGGLNVKSGTRIKHNDLYNLMLLRVFSHGKSNIGESDAILSNLDDYSSDFGVKIIEDKNKQAYKLRTAIQDYMIDPRGPQDPAKGVNTLKKFEFVERLISGQRTSLRGLSPTKVNKIVDAIQGSYLKLFENPGNVTRLNKTVSPLGSASRGAQQRESLEKKGAIDISMFDPSLLPEDVREFFPAVDKFSASYTGTPHKFALSYTNDDNKRILDFAAGTGYGEGDIENIKAIPISSTTGIKEPFITDPVLQNAGIWVNPKLHQSSIRNMVEDIEGYSPRVQDFIRSKLMSSANTDESGNVHSIDWNEFNNKYRRYGTLGKHLGTFQDLSFSMSRKRVSAHDTWWNMIPKEHNTERYADSELGKRVFYEEKLRYLLGRSSYKYVRDQFEGIKYSSMLFDTLEEYSKFKDHNVNIYNQGVKAFFKTVTNKAVPEFRGDKPAPGSLSSIFLRAMNQGGKLKNFINSITEGRKSYGLDLGEVSSDPVGDFPKIIKNLGKEGLIRDDFTTDLSKGKESDILKTMTSGKFLGNAISHSITQFTQSNDKIAKFFPNVEGQNPVRFVDDSEKLVGKGSLTDSTLGLFAEGIPSDIHAEYGDDKFKIKKEVVEAEVQRLSNLFQKIDTGDINIDDFDWTKSTPHVKAMSRPDKIMEYVRRNTNFDPRYRGAITELAKKEYDGIWDIDEHIDNFARGMSLDKIAKKTTTGHNITLSDLKKYGITSFGFEIPGLTPGTRTGMYGSSGTHNSRLDVFKDIYRTVNNKLLSNLTESTRKNVDPNYIGKTGIFRSDVEMAETHGQTGIPIQWIRDLEYRLKGNTRFTTGKFNDLTSDKDKYKVEYKDTLSDLRNQLEDAKNRGNRNDIVSIRNKISNYKQAYKESLFKDKGEGLTTKENKQPMGEYGEEFTYTGDEFNEELQNRITGNVKEINNLSILPKRYSDKPTSIHSRFLSGLYNYFSPGIFPRRSKLPLKAPEPKGYSVLHPSNYPWLPKLSHNDYVMTIPEQLEEFKPIPFQDLPDNTKFSKYDATRSLEEESRKRAKEGISYSGEILDNSFFSRLSRPMINSPLLIPLLQKFDMLSNLPYDVNEENIRGNYVSEISKIEDSENTGNKVNTHEQIQEKIIPGFNDGGMVPIRYNAGETIFDPEDVSKIGINNLKKLNALSDVVNPFGGHKLEGEYTEGDKNFGYAEPGSFILDRDSSEDKPKGYTLGGEVDPNATVDSTYNNLVNRRESSSVNAINAILDTLHKTIYGDKQRGLPGRGFTDNPTDVAEFKLIMDNLTKQFTSGNLKFSLVNPTDITKNLSGVLTSNINQQDANFMKGLAGRAAGISGQLNVPKTDLSKFEAGIAASSDAVKKMDWKPKSYEFKQTPFTQYKSVVNFESQDDLNKWKQENINFLSQITGIKSSKQLNTLGDIKETVTQQGGQRPIYSASGSFLIPKTAVEAAKTQGFDFANYFTELNASYADKISPHEAPHVLSESSTTGKNIEGFEKLNKHLGAGERLLNWMGKHMQTLNWAAVSVSMTAMGINFSLTNIYKVLQNTITTILSSASNLQSMFTNYSYAKIFGKDFIDIDAQLNKMGVSAGNFVDAWKRSTAVTAVASTLMSGMASKILLNTNFVKGLMDAFDAVVNKVTAGTKGNTILDKLSDMMVGKDGNGGLIASLPTLVDGLTTLVGILTSVAGQKGLVTFLAALVPMMWVIQPFMSILAGGSLIFSTFGKAALASSAYVDTFAFATNRAYAGVVKLVLALSTIVLLWEAVGRVVNYVAGQMVIPTPSELLLGKGAGVNEFNGAASFVGKAVGFATGYTPAEVGDTGVIEGSGGPTEDKNLVAVSRHEAIVKEKAMESPTNRALVSAMNHDRPIKIKGFAEGTPMPSVSLPDSYVSDQRYQMNINNSILQNQADSAYNSNNFLSSAYGGSGAFHVIVDNQSQLQGLAGISNETTNNSNITNGGITSFPWPTFPDFKFDISSITDWLKDIWERLGELKDKFGGEPKQDTKQDEKTDEKTDEKDKTKPDENKQDTKTDEKTGEDTGVKQSDVDRTREELADKFNELDKITSEANQRIIDEATTKNAGGDFKGGETNFPSAPEAKPEAPSWWDTLKSGVGDVIKDPKAFAADRLKAGAEFAINPIDPLLLLTGFGTAKGKGASNDEAAKESAIGLGTSTALMMGAGALGLGGIIGAVGEYAVPAAPLFGAKTTGENLPNQLVNSRTNNLPAGLSDEELSAIRKDITNKATKTAIENTPVPDQILSLGSGGMGTYGNGLLINAVGNAKMQNFHDTFENFRQNDFVKGANDLGSKAVNLGINTLSLAGSIPGINAFTLPFLGIGAAAKAPTELSKVSEGMPGLGVGTLTSASGIYDWLNEHGAAKPAINAMNNMFPGMGNLASFATLEGNKYEAMSTPNQEEAMKDFADKIKEKAGFLSIFGVNVNDMSDAVVKGTESQIKQVDATNILTDSQTNMTDACKYIPNALTGVQEKFLDLTNVSSDVNLKMGDLANKTMGVALPDGTKAQIAFNNQSNATATSIDALSKYGISISTAKDGAVTFSSQINPASVATGKLASSINTNIPKINTLGTSALTGAASILNTISQYNAQISNLIKNNTGTISSNTGTNQPQQSTYPSGNGGGGTDEEYKKTFEWGVQGNESLYLVEKYIENNSDKFKGKTLSDIQTMLTTSRGSVSGTMEYDPVFAKQLMYILSNSPQVLALLGITTAQPESPSKKPGARASGGLVTGPGSETSDSIPTLLSDNEFVVNADATKKNYSTLTAINSGKAIGDTTGNQYALWKASQALQNTISKMHKTSSSVANIVGNNSGNSVNSVPVQSEAKIINITVPVTIQGNVMDESLITQLSNEVARVIGLVSRKW